jgi:hypothetical protein
LTARIAHDFSNMLTVNTGNINLTQIVAPKNQIREVAASASRTSERAVALTRRLLAFACKQVLKPKPIDLLRLVEGMRDLSLQTLGPGARQIVSGGDAEQ